MQITAFLSSHLLLHKYIALKGIGTFSLKHFNGFHENETNTLYPPTVHIIFDEVDVFDTNLAKCISTQKNISTSDAQVELENWLNNIKTNLAHGNNFTLGKLGSLKMQNQKIQFTSFNDAYFNQANFGFKPQNDIVLNDEVFLPFVEEELKVAEQNLLPVTAHIESEQKPIIELQNSFEERIVTTISAPETEPTPQKNIPATKPPKHKTDWFWIIAIFIVCLTGTMVCATFIYFPPFKPVLQDTNTKSHKKTIDSLAAIQTLPDTTITYNIIVAENLTPLKAQKQLLKLKAIGIYGSLLTNDSTIIVQISAATFLQPDSAQTKLKQIQSKYYPKAYLKIIKSIN